MNCIFMHLQTRTFRVRQTGIPDEIQQDLPKLLLSSLALILEINLSVSDLISIIL